MEKLTSRKLWTAIVGVASGLMMYFSGDKQQGVALIMSSVVSYLIAEGIIDAASARSFSDTIDKAQENLGGFNEEGD